MQPIVMYGMTEIEYQPIKKIAVHEIIKQSYDDFLNGKARPQPPGGVPTQVRWVDGIVFTATAYPATPELVNAQVDGTVHWQHVEFAEMPDYQQMVTNQNSGGSATVVDYSSNTAVVDFIKWLKKQPQWFGDTAIP